MIWIRIFRTRKEAQRALVVLKELGIRVSISEDKYEGVPIQEYGVPARFRLNVRTKEEYFKAAELMAKKLKK